MRRALYITPADGSKLVLCRVTLGTIAVEEIYASPLFCLLSLL